jgi:hypothetical protein
MPPVAEMLLPSASGHSQTSQGGTYETSATKHHHRRSSHSGLWLRFECSGGSEEDCGQGARGQAQAEEAEGGGRAQEEEGRAPPRPQSQAPQLQCQQQFGRSSGVHAGAGADQQSVFELQLVISEFVLIRWIELRSGSCPRAQPGAAVGWR